MKNITKLFAVLVSSIMFVSTAIAGEMTVTGSATATYRIGGEHMDAGKAIGVANELTVKASGELDNGYTWSYAVDLDEASNLNDDTSLTLGTPYGTIGFFASEGGLSTEYANLSGALGANRDYANVSGADVDFQGYDVDGYANIQYHTPADLLPYGISLKYGYVPNMAQTGKGASAKAVGAENGATAGRSLEMLQVKASPIDGLSIAGDVARTRDQTGTEATNDEGVSANLGAKYTMGQLSIGYSEGGYNDAVDTAEAVIYEKKSYSLQFDVNDAISISYGNDEIDQGTRSAVAATASAGTKATVTNEVDSTQISYTVGGMTVGIARVEETNIDFGSTSDENTILSVAIAF